MLRPSGKFPVRFGWRFGLVIGLLSMLPWLPGVLSVREFNWDDIYLIEKNPALASPTLLLDCWTHPWGASTEVSGDKARNSGYYRPVTTVSLWVDRAIWGLHPGGYRFSSLLVHASSTVLLLWLLMLAGLSALPAAGFSLLWAWHPLQSEVLLTAAYRTTQLVVLLGLLSLHALLLARKRKPPVVWVVVSVLAFSAALFAKESALTLLVAIPAAAWSFGSLTWRREGLFLALASLAAVGWWWVRRETVTAPEAAVLGAIELGDRLLLMMKVPAEYLALFLWPARLNPHHDVSLFFPPMVDWRTWLGLALLALDLGLLALGLVRRRPWAGPLVAAHAVASTYMGIVPLQMMMAERFMVMPLLFLLLAVASRWSVGGAQAMSDDATASLSVPTWMAVLGTVVLLALGARGAVRTADWTDYRTLAESRVRDFPESFDARFSLAKTCFEAEQMDCAREQVEAALSIYPGFPLAVDLKRRLDEGP